MGTWPAFSWAMRPASMSVHITWCPASARQAPVTKPTYPQPITDRRKRISLVVENHFSCFKKLRATGGGTATATGLPSTVRASQVKSGAAAGEERSKADASNGRGEFRPAIHASLHSANLQDKSNVSAQSGALSCESANELPVRGAARGAQRPLRLQAARRQRLALLESR